MLQTSIAESISSLVQLCIGRDPSPTPKIVKNLCAFLCSDPLFTPLIVNNDNSNQAVTSSNNASQASEKFDSILTLTNTNTQAVVSQAVRRGRPGSAKRAAPKLATVDDVSDINLQDESEVHVYRSHS